MWAIAFREDRKVSIEHLPDPEPQRGEVVIAVKASGICHTDIEILRGNYGSSAFPLVAGHEFAGEVVAVGHDVSDISVGDRVVVDPIPRLPAGARGPKLPFADGLDHDPASHVTFCPGFRELHCERRFCLSVLSGRLT